ncbi:unnamed protein product [Pleuronectes platessa]|uniref:Uncharacterized protein n=1 Tax=Pleuronectes platessa TaxID=8262 RepID=A0A9N7YK53_PLEPL|nr:unnamed protein product [Pleuronectes platessa]
MSELIPTNDRIDWAGTWAGAQSGYRSQTSGVTSYSHTLKAAGKHANRSQASVSTDRVICPVAKPRRNILKGAVGVNTAGSHSTETSHAKAPWHKSCPHIQLLPGESC